MSTEAHPIVQGIEHLDFEPPCEASTWGPFGCNGTNPADYLTISRHCSNEALMCPGCVTWRIALGERLWTCRHCGHAVVERWLDGVTLHPIRVTR